MIVYISIGNSDDKLTQIEWAQYIDEMRALVVSGGHTHGAWFSVPDSPYQNACWCIEFATAADAADARRAAIEIRARYRQDSVSWAVVTEAEFI